MGFKDIFKKQINIKKEIKKSTKQDFTKSKYYWSLKRRETIKIIRNLNNKKISSLFFYTNESNIMRILEYGIQPINDINLKYNDKYIVWTYLEKGDHVELELSNSTRHYFWQWINQNNIDPNSIAIISIKIQKLFEKTKEDWIYNDKDKRIIIKENIPPECIEWILLKNFNYYERVKKYVDIYNLEIKIFSSKDSGLLYEK